MRGFSQKGRLAQRRHAGILGIALIDGLARGGVQRVQHLRRRGQVGIAHREADDIHSLRTLLGDLAAISGEVVRRKLLQTARKLHRNLLTGWQMRAG